MNEMEALDYFLNSSRRWWPFRPGDGSPDEAVLMMVAAVSLSGMMHECKTEADMKNAFDHFHSLYNSDIISPEQWFDEAQRIDRKLKEWGELFKPEIKRIAESN